MAGGGGQAPGDDKNSMEILWIIGGIMLLAAVIWWAFAEQLKYLFINLRAIELLVLYKILKLQPFFADTIIELENAIVLTNSVTTSNITLSTAEYLSTLSGKIYRWPISLCLIVFAYIIFTTSIKTRYKKHYDMKKLAQQECIEWPQMNPILGLNLVEEDLDKGPWAMGMAPLMFCKQHQLIVVGIVPQVEGTLSKGPKFKAILDQSKAEQVFVQQLGRMWRGPENIPIHRRALLAAFIARGMRDTKTAQNLIMQINRSATSDHSKELDFTGTDELWKKHYNAKPVQSIVQAHTYELTLFMGFFLFARQDGVFATSDFLWLKPRDRSFWSVLNSVGRQTPSCEAAAVHAHFLAEKALGRSLSVPMIGEATKALQLALNDIIYLPDEVEKEQLLKADQEANA